MGTTHLFNFDNATIVRFQKAGENRFAVERPCILDRYSLALTAGTGIYSIPDYIQNIKRVTYQGWEVWPLPHRSLRQSYLSGTQQSRPYWYIINNVGLQQIQLFPVPSADLAQITPWTDLWGPQISVGFIIEFYRSPDFTTTNYRIPTYFKNELVDAYANKRCFAIDGPGQTMAGVKFWSEKFAVFTQIFTELMDDLNNKPRNLIASDGGQRPYGYTPPPPMLPIDRFGISVDEPSW